MAQPKSINELAAHLGITRQAPSQEPEQKPTPKQTSIAIPKFIRLSKLIAQLGVSRRVGYYWAKQGLLPGAVQLNGAWLVEEATVSAWIRDGQQKMINPPEPIISPNWYPSARPEYIPTSRVAQELKQELLKRRKRREAAKSR
ncbi:putative DNA-binding transcriptional regulator AlpA [Rhodoblastus acidophilus]|uniref:helix-turn-helix transcriptional regulator n=1 Tax=Rhodoblastus acidophilus TaxID=1074 RepID=UPI002225B107|nr:helix-turn-helix domain-containing protein [Rhodoblastus acidophilus]MCW2284721.1 putative DNA-binding transcriptional regulator AlpA [Rhodoblastus acidophilus]MCW2333674.1 putative DNA-binding transcriptional regulator AlpA [Rhodoblastus acidophilus]